MQVIDDIFPELPIDLDGPAPAFRPYKDRARAAFEWLKENASIIGLALAVLL